MITTSLPTPLGIEVYRSPSAVRVAVAGEVDMSTTESLLGILLRTLSASRPGRIEVDLADVTFLDCSGLTVLLVARETAVRSGCQLMIVNPRPAVRRIFTVTGLHDILIAGNDPARSAATDEQARAPIGVLGAAAA